MPFIHLTTFIMAPRERVFDLSRSVSVHKHSMAKHSEQIVDGISTGLMQLNDTVTWKARHLFRERTLKSKVTEMRPPEYFVDEQVQGDFFMMKHEHYFKSIENGTIMIDQLRFEIPYGVFGEAVNKFFLEKYMTRLLQSRNEVIRHVAEGNQWKQFLS
jgi:ligand-binding SRPBCC domain-containing protein